MLDSESVQIQSAKVLEKTETEIFEPKSADEDDADFSETSSDEEKEIKESESENVMARSKQLFNLPPNSQIV